MSDSLIKEAENIIDEYIKDKRGSDLPVQCSKKRSRQPNNKLIVNTVLNISLLAGVAFLIYMVCRLF